MGLMKAEDWLYDQTDDTTKAAYVEKLDELKRTGDTVAWRHNEDQVRDEWVTAVEGTISNYKQAAENPGTKYNHIAAEKLQQIITACGELSTWLTQMKAKQDALPKTEKPVLLCAKMEEKNKELANMADKILQEPKPAPPPAP